MNDNDESLRGLIEFNERMRRIMAQDQEALAHQDAESRRMTEQNSMDAGRPVPIDQPSMSDFMTLANKMKPAAGSGAASAGSGAAGAGHTLGGGLSSAAGGGTTAGGGATSALSAAGPWAALAAAIVGHNEWAERKGLRDGEKFKGEYGLTGRALFKDKDYYAERAEKIIPGLGEEIKLGASFSSPVDLFRGSTWKDAGKSALTGGILGKALKKIF